ncbi:ATP-binding cassette domain-containing protein, partial [Acidihalobacter prosperus]
GAGKSTLMRLIAGEIPPDSGDITYRDAVRVTYLGQEIPAYVRQTVYEVVADGIGELGNLLAEFHRLSELLGKQDAHAGLVELERVQHDIEARDGWNAGSRISTVISRLELPGDATFESLSGGLKRRVLLARALVAEPDLLLLDEPTNHLDIEAIAWLEDFLRQFQGSLLIVTHDRAFASALATVVLDLDRGQLTRYDCGYNEYLYRKSMMLEVESAQNREFDRKLAIEEEWIRKGIKARRTRNEGRVRALEAMRAERRARRERMGRSSMSVDTGALSGRLVAEVRSASVSLGGRTIVRELNLTLMRGDKLGIIGPNGSGKTSLLRLLTGDLAPVRGQVRLGTGLSTAYFDQHREQLDPDSMVVDVVGEGSTQVTINGQSKHIIGYLQDFLFSPERARGPVRALSGGERNRLLLAKLFAHEANLLIMDEPTNDLDVETLEILEALLVSYQGTLILVSHDRAFLDNVVTSTLAFEGDGRFAEYVGGYQDWLRQSPSVLESQERTDVSSPKKQTLASDSRQKTSRKLKLSYKDQRELDGLPDRIAALEVEKTTLETQLSNPDLYRYGDDVRKVQSRLEAVTAELEDSFLRWEELESVQCQ